MNTTEFLAAVERAITVPTYQPRFTKDDLLALAAEEQRTTVVPKLLSLRQNYLLWRQAVPVVALTSQVSFPARAIGRGSKQIAWLPAGANEQENELTEFTLRESRAYPDDDQGVPSGFTEFGDKVKLLPRPLEAGTAVFYIYAKPSKPVFLTRCAQVQSVGVGAVTLATSVPSNITVGALVDFTKGTPGNNLLLADVPVSNIAGNTLTLTGLTADDLAGVAAGDWVSLAGETAVLQLPEEMQDVLTYAVAVRVLMALQLPEQLKLVQGQMDLKVMNAEMLLSPRVEDQTEVIFSGHPLLGMGGGRYFPRVTVTDQ